MNELKLTLPDQVAPDEATMLLSMKLYEVGRLSLEQAAELAGYSLRTFMELLGRQQVPVFNTAADEVASDLANA